ncbi:MAG: AbrB family transcriptional regulator, partial [Rubrobacteraceae bacterium]
MRFKIPLAALMGALTGTVLVQSLGLTSLEPAPPLVRNVLYAAVGLMIGLRITRSSLHKLRGVVAPAVMVPAVMIVSGVLLGLLYATLAPDDSRLRLDLQTAVLSITPGGFQELVIAAQQMDALLAVVVTTHMIRIMTVLYAYPKIVQSLVSRLGDERPVEDDASEDRTDEGPQEKRANVVPWLAIISGTAVGGAFGAWSGIPAGTVVFAMLGAAAVKT